MSVNLPTGVSCQGLGETLQGLGETLQQSFKFFKAGCLLEGDKLGVRQTCDSQIVEYSKSRPALAFLRPQGRHLLSIATTEALVAFSRAGTVRE